jgi:FtsP/CotA-like multicopper oxidase with cupredoxin domain
MSNDTALQEQYSDNTIINGRMPYNCSLVTDGTPCSQSTYSKFRVTPGKTYKLRLINTAAGGWQHFSIDGYNLTIVANDFVAIHPYSTKIVTLGVSRFLEARIP